MPVVLSKDIITMETETAMVPTERLRITNDGNVGVGTVTPSQKLHVQGSILSSDLNANTVVISSASKVLSSSSVGTTALGYLQNVTSDIQTQLNGKFSSTGGTISGNVVVSGAFTTSNLNVLGNTTIVNAYSTYTSNIIIENLLGVGPALTVRQKTIAGRGNVAEFYDTDLASPSNLVLSITDGGNVGIGTGTALAKMHIYHLGSGDIIRVDDQTAPDPNPFVINENGNVGIGTGSFVTEKLVVSGNVLVSGDITAFGTLSDARLKENVTTLSGSLDKIASLRPVQFTWKDEAFLKDKRNTHDIGLLAQEVQEVLPEITQPLRFPDAPEHYQGVRYEKLIPHMIEAIQELQVQVKELQQQNQS